MDTEAAQAIVDFAARNGQVHNAKPRYRFDAEGHVRLTNDKGEAQDFKAPESFLVPSGFAGTWEAVTPVRKFFVIYEKAAK